MRDFADRLEIVDCHQDFLQVEIDPHVYPGADHQRTDSDHAREPFDRIQTRGELELALALLSNIKFLSFPKEQARHSEVMTLWL